jgi:tetratricopeptide (TPR) repeat protein
MIMNRLTMVACVCAVVFAAAAVVQTFRVWELQGEAGSLRTAASGPQKDARKTAGSGKRTAGTGGDNWNPVATGAARGKGGGSGAEVKAETAVGTPGAEGGAQTAISSPADAGRKGGRNRVANELPKDAKAAGLVAAVAAASDGANKSGRGAATPEAAARSDELSRSALQSLRDGNLDQAHEKLRQSVQENPKNSDAWRNLASVERQLGKSEDELATYQKWIEEQPEDKLARYMAAEAYARNGMDSQALQYLADFQSMSTDNPQSYAMTAGVYQQMNMTAEQGDALRQWVSAAPTSPDAHRVLGDYYQRMGQGDQAIAEYQAMATLQPNTATPYIQMGNAYSQMGQIDAAQAQFETAVSLRPNDVEALTRLADIQRQAGDMQGAVTNYQRVATLEPGSNAGVQAARNIQFIQEQMAAQAQRPAQ